MQIEGAVFYDCDPDAESYTHRTVAEAVLDRLDWCAGETIAHAIVAIAPLRVIGYRRVQPDDAVLRRAAEIAADYAIEEAIERYDEEYGDHFGGHETDVATDERKRADAAITATLIDMLRTIEPWGCEPCGELMLSAEELTAIVREHAPEWLEATDAR